MSLPAAPVPWPNGARCAASFSFDVDAESAMLGVSTKHASRMSAISHQAYGPLTGIPRLLEILAGQGVTSTFFVPGYTAVRYPDVITGRSSTPGMRSRITATCTNPCSV